MYYNDFDNWADVQEEFQMVEPEPEEVLVADYSCEDYEGDAYVVYRKGNMYYTVNGGHCSCFGLEGQWEPEAYDIQTLYLALDKSNPYGVEQAHKFELLRVLKERF